MGMGCSAEQCTCARTEADKGTDRVDDAPPPSDYATAGLGNKKQVAPSQGDSPKAEIKDELDLRLPSVTPPPPNKVQRVDASSEGLVAPSNVVSTKATGERSSQASVHSLVSIPLHSTDTKDIVGDSPGRVVGLPEEMQVPPKRSRKQDGFVEMEPTWTQHYSDSTDCDEFEPTCTTKPDTSGTQHQSDQVELQVFLNANNFDSYDLNRPRTSMLKATLPLHAAINQGRPDIVGLLLQAKADPTKKTASGQTSWKLARNLKGEMAAEVLALLGEEPVDTSEKKAGVFRRLSGK